MNDLERDLRDVLGEDARRVPTPTSAPEGLRRSVHRRQAVFAGLVGLSAVVVVAGVVAGAGLLLSKPGGTVPAAAIWLGVGAIGKQVDTVSIQGWSMDKPSEDGATFELRWNN